MHTAISSKTADIANVCRGFDVERLTVFGSGARGYDFDPDSSDVDFLVEFKADSKITNTFDRYFYLKKALSEMLGRPVDLVHPCTLNDERRIAGIYAFTELVYEDKSHSSRSVKAKLTHHE